MGQQELACRYNKLAQLLVFVFWWQLLDPYRYDHLPKEKIGRRKDFLDHIVQGV